MNYEYKVACKGDESGVISGPDGFGMAFKLAQHWAHGMKRKRVRILRADTSGINAGKFFLHQIIGGAS